MCGSPGLKSPELQDFPLKTGLPYALTPFKTGSTSHPLMRNEKCQYVCENVVLV